MSKGEQIYWLPPDDTSERGPTQFSATKCHHARIGTSHVAESIFNSSKV
jgi:hypothetical protein